jgi:hypothetical protein
MARQIRNIKQAHHSIVTSKFAAVSGGTLQPISGKPALIAGHIAHISIPPLPRLSRAQVARIREAYASYAGKVLRDPTLVELRDVFEDWVEFAIE